VVSGAESLAGTVGPDIELHANHERMKPFLRPGKAALIAAVVLLAAALVIAALMVSRTAESGPVYQGKSLQVWLREYHRSRTQVGENGTECLKAEEAIHRIGTNGIPTLLQMLRAKDSALMSELQEHDNRYLLLKVNSNPAWLQNWDASMGFELLGQDAEDAVPALLEIYKQNISGRSRMATAWSLAGIGRAARAAVPTLVRAATNSDPSMRPSALWGLMGIRSDPAMSIPVMVGCLSDTNRIVQALAFRGVVEFGGEAYPVLTQLLSSQDVNLSRSAAGTLIRLKANTVGQTGLDPRSEEPLSPTKGLSQ
jgi:hypothetical protein